MKFIKSLYQKFIFNQAESIKKKQEEAEALETKKKMELSAAYDKKAAKRKSAKDLLYAFLKEQEKAFMKKFPQPFQIGDVVILNKYNIGKNSSNGWDMGAQAIFSCLDKKNYDGLPIFGPVTKVQISHSYSEELVDKWLSDQSDERIALMMETQDHLVRTYVMWFNNYARLTISNHLGMYWDVFFELNIKFQPRWGLNSNSFHLLDSELGKKTKEIWEEEASIDYLLEEASNRTLLLTTRKKELLNI